MKTMRDNTVVWHDGDVLISNVNYKDNWKEIKKFWLVDVSKNQQGYATPIWDDEENGCVSHDNIYEYITGWTWTNEGPTWDDLVNIASEIFVVDRGTGDIFDVEDWMESNELSSDIASAVEEVM